MTWEYICVSIITCFASCCSFNMDEELEEMEMKVLRQKALSTMPAKVSSPVRLYYNVLCSIHLDTCVTLLSPVPLLVNLLVTPHNPLLGCTPV